jgi:hypothetical protein
VRIASSRWTPLGAWSGSGPITCSRRRQSQGTTGAAACDRPDGDRAADRAPTENARPFCGSFFMCGTPMETKVSAAGLEKPDLENARALLKESAYDGRPVIFMRRAISTPTSTPRSWSSRACGPGGRYVAWFEPQHRHPRSGLRLLHRAVPLDGVVDPHPAWVAALGSHDAHSRRAGAARRGARRRRRRGDVALPP